MMKILFIDNFDSFTYNLVDEFKKLGNKVIIYRNDISLKQLDEILKRQKPKLIVISPGPSHPKDAGICKQLIKKYYKKYPMLGICLGHQCMIESLGGKVTKAPIPVHGKKSTIIHNNNKLFKNIPNPFHAGRYHSLYGSKVPEFFRVTAETENIPMAIENSKYNIYGLQFHPESILTAHGSIIIKNILKVIK